MHNQLRTAAVQVRQSLRPAEHSVQSAIENTARLTLAISEAQATTRTPFTIGQEVYQELSKSFALMVEARGCVARAHANLARLPQELEGARGIPAHAWGDTAECPDEKASLTLVSTIAA